MSLSPPPASRISNRKQFPFESTERAALDTLPNELDFQKYYCSTFFDQNPEKIPKLPPTRLEFEFEIDEDGDSDDIIHDMPTIINDNSTNVIVKNPLLTLSTTSNTNGPATIPSDLIRIFSTIPITELSTSFDNNLTVFDIFYIIRNNHLTALKHQISLLSRIDLIHYLNQCNNVGTTPLVAAVMANRLNFVVYLLQIGLQNEFIEPFFYQDLFEKSESNGLNFGEKNNILLQLDNSDVFLHAARRGNLPIIYTLLIQPMISVSTLSKSGKTILHYLAINQHKEVIEFCLGIKSSQIFYNYLNSKNVEKLFERIDTILFSQSQQQDLLNKMTPLMYAIEQTASKIHPPIQPYEENYHPCQSDDTIVHLLLQIQFKNQFFAIKHFFERINPPTTTSLQDSIFLMNCNSLDALGVSIRSLSVPIMHSLFVYSETMFDIITLLMTHHAYTVDTLPPTIKALYLSYKYYLLRLYGQGELNCLMLAVQQPNIFLFSYIYPRFFQQYQLFIQEFYQIPPNPTVSTQNQPNAQLSRLPTSINELTKINTTIGHAFSPFFSAFQPPHSTPIKFVSPFHHILSHPHPTSNASDVNNNGFVPLYPIELCDNEGRNVFLHLVRNFNIMTQWGTDIIGPVVNVTGMYSQRDGIQLGDVGGENDDGQIEIDEKNQNGKNCTNNDEKSTKEDKSDEETTPSLLVFNVNLHHAYRTLFYLIYLQSFNLNRKDTITSMISTVDNNGIGYVSYLAAHSAFKTISFLFFLVFSPFFSDVIKTLINPLNNSLNITTHTGLLSIPLCYLEGNVVEMHKIYLNSLTKINSPELSRLLFFTFDFHHHNALYHAVVANNRDSVQYLAQGIGLPQTKAKFDQKMIEFIRNDTERDLTVQICQTVLSTNNCVQKNIKNMNIFDFFHTFGLVVSQDNQSQTRPNSAITGNITYNSSLSSRIVDGIISSPLVYSVSKKMIETALLLIKYGANINTRDQYGNSVFMLAIESQNRELIIVLMNSLKRHQINILKNDFESKFNQKFNTKIKKIGQNIPITNLFPYILSTFGQSEDVPTLLSRATYSVVKGCDINDSEAKSTTLKKPNKITKQASKSSLFAENTGSNLKNGVNGTVEGMTRDSGSRGVEYHDAKNQQKGNVGFSGEISADDHNSSKKGGKSENGTVLHRLGRLFGRDKTKNVDQKIEEIETTKDDKMVQIDETRSTKTTTSPEPANKIDKKGIDSPNDKKKEENMIKEFIIETRNDILQDLVIFIPPSRLRRDFIEEYLIPQKYSQNIPNSSPNMSNIDNLTIAFLPDQTSILDITCINDNGWSCLTYACQSGDLSLFLQILENIQLFLIYHTILYQGYISYTKKLDHLLRRDNIDRKVQHVGEILIEKNNKLNLNLLKKANNFLKKFEHLFHPKEATTLRSKKQLIQKGSNYLKNHHFYKLFYNLSSSYNTLLNTYYKPPNLKTYTIDPKDDPLPLGIQYLCKLRYLLSTEHLSFCLTILLESLITPHFKHNITDSYVNQIKVIQEVHAGSGEDIGGFKNGQSGSNIVTNQQSGPNGADDAPNGQKLIPFLTNFTSSSNTPTILNIRQQLLHQLQSDIITNQAILRQDEQNNPGVDQCSQQDERRAQKVANFNNYFSILKVLTHSQTSTLLTMGNLMLGVARVDFSSDIGHNSMKNYNFFQQFTNQNSAAFIGPNVHFSAHLPPILASTVNSNDNVAIPHYLLSLGCDLSITDADYWEFQKQYRDFNQIQKNDSKKSPNFQNSKVFPPIIDALNPNFTGNNAFHYAAMCGFPNLLQLYIDYYNFDNCTQNSPLFARNEQGLYPIHLALLHHRYDCVELLLPLYPHELLIQTVPGRLLFSESNFDQNSNLNSNFNLLDLVIMGPIYEQLVKLSTEIDITMYDTMLSSSRLFSAFDMMNQNAKKCDIFFDIFETKNQNIEFLKLFFYSKKILNSLMKTLNQSHLYQKYQFFETISERFPTISTHLIGDAPHDAINPVESDHIPNSTNTNSSFSPLNHRISKLISLILSKLPLHIFFPTIQSGIESDSQSVSNTSQVAAHFVVKPNRPTHLFSPFLTQVNPFFVTSSIKYAILTLNEPVVCFFISLCSQINQSPQFLTSNGHTILHYLCLLASTASSTVLSATSGTRAVLGPIGGSVQNRNHTQRGLNSFGHFFHDFVDFSYNLNYLRLLMRILSFIKANESIYHYENVSFELNDAKAGKGSLNIHNHPPSKSNASKIGSNWLPYNNNALVLATYRPFYESNRDNEEKDNFDEQNEQNNTTFDFPLPQRSVRFDIHSPLVLNQSNLSNSSSSAFKLPSFLSLCAKYHLAMALTILYRTKPLESLGFDEFYQDSDSDEEVESMLRGTDIDILSPTALDLPSKSEISVAKIIPPKIPNRPKELHKIQQIQQIQNNNNNNLTQKLIKKYIPKFPEKIKHQISTSFENITYHDNLSRNCIHYACYHNNITALQLFLKCTIFYTKKQNLSKNWKKLTFFSTDRYGFDPMAYAIMFGHYQCVLLLIEAGYEFPTQKDINLYLSELIFDVSFHLHQSKISPTNIEKSIEKSIEKHPHNSAPNFSPEDAINPNFIVDINKKDDGIELVSSTALAAASRFNFSPTFLKKISPTHITPQNDHNLPSKSELVPTPVFTVQVDHMDGMGGRIVPLLMAFIIANSQLVNADLSLTLTTTYYETVSVLQSFAPILFLNLGVNGGNRDDKNDKNDDLDHFLRNQKITQKPNIKAVYDVIIKNILKIILPLSEDLITHVTHPMVIGLDRYGFDSYNGTGSNTIDDDYQEEFENDNFEKNVKNNSNNAHILTIPPPNSLWHNLHFQSFWTNKSISALINFSSEYSTLETLFPIIISLKNFKNNSQFSHLSSFFIIQSVLCKIRPEYDQILPFLATIVELTPDAEFNQGMVSGSEKNTFSRSQNIPNHQLYSELICLVLYLYLTEYNIDIMKSYGQLVQSRREIGHNSPKYPPTIAYFYQSLFSLFQPDQLISISDNIIAGGVNNNDNLTEKRQIRQIVPVSILITLLTTPIFPFSGSYYGYKHPTYHNISITGQYLTSRPVIMTLPSLSFFLNKKSILFIFLQLFLITNNTQILLNHFQKIPQIPINMSSSANSIHNIDHLPDINPDGIDDIMLPPHLTLLDRMFNISDQISYYNLSISSSLPTDTSDLHQPGDQDGGSSGPGGVVKRFRSIPQHLNHAGFTLFAMILTGFIDEGIHNGVLIQLVQIYTFFIFTEANQGKNEKIEKIEKTEINPNEFSLLHIYNLLNIFLVPSTSFTRLKLPTEINKAVKDSCVQKDAFCSSLFSLYTPSTDLLEYIAPYSSPYLFTTLLNLSYFLHSSQNKNYQKNGQINSFSNSKLFLFRLKTALFHLIKSNYLLFPTPNIIMHFQTTMNRFNSNVFGLQYRQYHHIEQPQHQSSQKSPKNPPKFHHSPLLTQFFPSPITTTTQLYEGFFFKYLPPSLAAQFTPEYLDGHTRFTTFIILTIYDFLLDFPPFPILLLSDGYFPPNLPPTADFFTHLDISRAVLPEEEWEVDVGTDKLVNWLTLSLRFNHSQVSIVLFSIFLTIIGIDISGQYTTLGGYIKLLGNVMERFVDQGGQDSEEITFKGYVNAKSAQISNYEFDLFGFDRNGMGYAGDVGNDGERNEHDEKNDEKNEKMKNFVQNFYLILLDLISENRFEISCAKRFIPVGLNHHDIDQVSIAHLLYSQLFESRSSRGESDDFDEKFFEQKKLIQIGPTIQKNVKNIKNVKNNQNAVEIKSKKNQIEEIILNFISNLDSLYLFNSTESLLNTSTKPPDFIYMNPFSGYLTSFHILSNYGADFIDYFNTPPRTDPINHQNNLSTQQITPGSTPESEFDENHQENSIPSFLSQSRVNQAQAGVLYTLFLPLTFPAASSRSLPDEAKWNQEKDKMEFFLTGFFSNQKNIPLSTVQFVLDFFFLDEKNSSQKSWGVQNDQFCENLLKTPKKPTKNEAAPKKAPIDPQFLIQMILIVLYSCNTFTPTYDIGTVQDSHINIAKKVKTNSSSSKHPYPSILSTTLDPLSIIKHIIMLSPQEVIKTILFDKDFFDYIIVIICLKNTPRLLNFFIVLFSEFTHKPYILPPELTIPELDIDFTDNIPARLFDLVLKNNQINNFYPISDFKNNSKFFNFFEKQQKLIHISSFSSSSSIHHDESLLISAMIEIGLAYDPQKYQKLPPTIQTSKTIISAASTSTHPFKFIPNSLFQLQSNSSCVQILNAVSTLLCNDTIHTIINTDFTIPLNLTASSLSALSQGNSGGFSSLPAGKMWDKFDPILNHIAKNVHFFVPNFDNFLQILHILTQKTNSPSSPNYHNPSIVNTRILPRHTSIKTDHNEAITDIQVKSIHSAPFNPFTTPIVSPTSSLTEHYKELSHQVSLPSSMSLIVDCIEISIANGWVDIVHFLTAGVPFLTYQLLSSVEQSCWSVIRGDNPGLGAGLKCYEDGADVLNRVLMSITEDDERNGKSAGCSMMQGIILVLISRAYLAFHPVYMKENVKIWAGISHGQKNDQDNVPMFPKLIINTSNGFENQFKALECYIGHLCELFRKFDVIQFHGTKTANLLAYNAIISPNTHDNDRSTQVNSPKGQYNTDFFQGLGNFDFGRQNVSFQSCYTPVYPNLITSPHFTPFIRGIVTPIAQIGHNNNQTAASSSEQPNERQYAYNQPIQLCLSSHFQTIPYSSVILTILLKFNVIVFFKELK